MTLRWTAIILIVTTLSACSFGVPVGYQQNPASTGATLTKSKSGNPSSYIVNGRRYYVLDSAAGYKQRGIASWYGPNFHGKNTSSGETYNMHALTAAHKTLPIPVYVQVTNLENGKKVTVKVNDRGPFAKGRIIDLSYAAANKLDMIRKGTAQVEVVALDASGNRYTEKARPVAYNETSREGSLYIQLGSFSENANARQYLNQLSSDNETALSIKKVATEQGEFYRVLIGPLLNVSEAENVLQRLQDKGYQNARIIVHDPA